MRGALFQRLAALSGKTRIRLTVTYEKRWRTALDEAENYSAVVGWAA